jgi:hypothetical protein
MVFDRLIWKLEAKKYIGIKSSPVTGLGWPRVFQGIKVPRFHDKSKGWW